MHTINSSGRPKKKALIDASSAIILYKADLHETVAGLYEVILAGSVYREITGRQHPGSAEYELMAAEKKIRVLEITDQRERTAAGGIGIGEYETIQLFHDGEGDFVITDDGRAARYCNRKGIPFINALLFPVVMRYAQVEDDAFCRRSMERIAGIGRYSEKVLSCAGTCGRESIAFAIP